MKEMVLVSGGAGYIGSHTAVELINAGYDVVVADNLSNSDMSGVEGVRKITGVDVPFVNVDCCDKEAFSRVFEQYKFNSVIHFAAFKAVGESVTDPMKYDYTVPMTLFASLGVLALFFALWLKVIDVKGHYGLERPNVIAEDAKVELDGME